MVSCRTACVAVAAAAAWMVCSGRWPGRRADASRHEPLARSRGRRLRPRRVLWIRRGYGSTRSVKASVYYGRVTCGSRSWEASCRSVRPSRWSWPSGPASASGRRCAAAEPSRCGPDKSSPPSPSASWSGSCVRQCRGDLRRRVRRQLRFLRLVCVYLLLRRSRLLRERSDPELVNLIRQQMASLGFTIRDAEWIGGHVARIPAARPSRRRSPPEASKPPSATSVPAAWLRSAAPGR